MGLHKVEKQFLSDFYDQAVTIELKKWDKFDAEKVSEAFMGAKDKKAGLSLRILGKAACQFDTKESFMKAMESADIPAIKLNGEEMNMLKGGSKWSFVANTVGETGLKTATSFVSRVFAQTSSGNFAKTLMRTEVEGTGRVVYQYVGGVTKLPKPGVNVGDTLRLTIDQGISILQKVNPFL